MMERTTINTNIRLNLNKLEDRQAWEYLQNMDRKKYKSYSRAVVAAINDHFSRQERVVNDPFLEFREKEDAFLQKILDTIREGLQSSDAGLASLSALLQAVQAASLPAQETMTDENLDIAMEFMDSL
jgi:hypothetical protein